MNVLHNWDGILVLGIEPHWGVPLPFFSPFGPFAEFNILQSFRKGGNQKDSVIWSGAPAVAYQHASEHPLPHLSLPPNAFMALHIWLGTHVTPWMVSSILVENEMACVAILPAGATLQGVCTDFGHLPIGVGANPGTVVTQVTLEDLINSIISICLEVILYCVLILAFAGATKLLGRFARPLLSRIGPLARLLEAQAGAPLVGEVAPAAGTSAERTVAIAFFRPFLLATENAADDTGMALLRGLEQEGGVANTRFLFFRLGTSTQSIEAFLAALGENGVDDVIVMGQRAQGDLIQAEIQAILREGYTPNLFGGAFGELWEQAVSKATGQAWTAGVPMASGMPVGQIAGEAGITTSQNAGTYYCNYVYQELLNNGFSSSTFLHLQSGSGSQAAGAVMDFLQALLHP